MAGVSRAAFSLVVAAAYLLAAMVYGLVKLLRWSLVAALALVALPFVLAGLVCLVVVVVVAVPVLVIAK